jgi:hypothetical protein
MTQDECQECNRIHGEIQSFVAQANTLRQGKLQNEEPLGDDPADWLLGFESDEAITDQLREIGQGITRLRNEQARHIAQEHVDH